MARDVYSNIFFVTCNATELVLQRKKQESSIASAGYLPEMLQLFPWK
jgi:hypothetical protein